MSCNTNNGTERINGDLKHDELVGFKNCSPSELLEIIISRFLPKFYRKYVSLNVKFSSGYKTYAENIPSYLQNKPRSLVTFLLERAQRVSTLMIDSVREQTDGSFEVCSDGPGINGNLSTRFLLEITKHFEAAHVEILEEQGFCGNTSLLS